MCSTILLYLYCLYIILFSSARPRAGLFLRTLDPRAQYEWQLAQQLGLGIAGARMRASGWVWVNGMKMGWRMVEWDGWGVWGMGGRDMSGFEVWM